MTETKRIFVSHKASNSKITSDMLDILKSGMTGVEFFLSEKIEPGDNWRSDIVKAIKAADCLLLPHLDPDQDWSWCMFEAGLFSAYKPKDEERRLYCIHYEDSPPPGPLKEIQTIAATLDGMKTFLDAFYLATKQTNTETWSNRDATASRLVSFLHNSRPKKIRYDQSSTLGAALSGLGCTRSAGLAAAEDPQEPPAGAIRGNHRKPELCLSAWFQRRSAENECSRLSYTSGHRRIRSKTTVDGEISRVSTIYSRRPHDRTACRVLSIDDGEHSPADHRIG